MEGAANAAAVIARALNAWRPPPKQTLSQWADKNFYLSPESAAEPGRWKTIPYQVEPMDAVTDPAIMFVTFMKSARIGFTKIIDAAIGYHIEHAPCSQMVVQPTIEDAKGFSKEEIAPMLRDCPTLSAIVFDDATEAVGPKESGNTILHKHYPGGVLSLAGANSGTGFRRISRKVIYLDEVDGYPVSAGSDGDPVKLATKRSEYFWDRKIVAGSTPKLAGHSRIEAEFLKGDQRYYYVPCPQCGHFDRFVFTRSAEGGGHAMKWEEGKPETAYMECSKNGCVIEHASKRDMVARGRWKPTAPFTGHASFHIWAAYSFSPNTTWAQLVQEFLEAKRGGPTTLQTFVNTALGETWKEQGEAPDWERLYLRREHYEIGTVQPGAKFLTAGVDVQQDRFVVEVVGWGADKESWVVEAFVIPCDTAKESSWALLDELLTRQWETERGPLTIRMLAIDSGYNTQTVYAWARKHLGRVIAVKGSATCRTLVGTPTDVDVTRNGRRITRYCKVWPVGPGIAKSELYGFLRSDPPKVDGERFPLGYCHFPQLGEDYFKQLTGEHLVKVTAKRTGFVTLEWQLIPGRENHFLDCRVYARAAAHVLGLDRMAPRPAAPPPTAPALPAVAPAPPPREPRAPKPKRQIPDSYFWKRRDKGFW